MYTNSLRFRSKQKFFFYLGHFDRRLVICAETWTFKVVFSHLPKPCVHLFLECILWNISQRFSFLFEVVACSALTFDWFMTEIIFAWLCCSKRWANWGWRWLDHSAVLTPLSALASCCFVTWPPARDKQRTGIDSAHFFLAQCGNAKLDFGQASRWSFISMLGFCASAEI